MNEALHDRPFTTVRVADAPPLALPKGFAAQNAMPEPVVLCQVLLVMLLVHFSWFLLGPGLAPLQPYMVLARYGLWLTIPVVAALQIIARGPEPILRALMPWLPYLLVGIVSGLLGAAVTESMRVLAYWLLGVLAAASIGVTLPPSRMLRILHTTFATFVVVSVLVSLLFPALGLQANSRSESGFAWRGVFPGKNQFGEICAYALLFGLAVAGISRKWRVALMGVGWFALWKTNSQSALVLAGAQVVYWLSVQRLRRLRLPPWGKAGALAALLIALALVALVGKNLLLALLGRDATLTGRSDIWAMWLARAMQHWLIGAGPSTFTMPGSTTTADLALAFQAYGSILTPHNMYIAVFGEVGIIGLVMMVIPLAFMLVAVPFLHNNEAGLTCGAVAMTMALGGMGETHEVFGIGLNMALLVMIYASAIGIRIIQRSQS